MEAAHYEQAELWGDEHVFDPQNQLPKFAAIHELLPAPVPSAMLDVGAGDGRLFRYLLERGTRSTMVITDRSRAALDAVPPTGGVVRGVQAGIDALPFPDRAFPVAVCSEVLEHLPGPVYDRARAELARVAAEHVVVTVPNRERRARADITCGECGCRYNPDRHLRSFHPDDLATLLPGFAVERIVETGPHQPVYPRWARLALERAGLLARPGSPTCPQCGARYPHARAAAGNGDGGGHGIYGVARRLVPKARHPYFLCARFRRTS